MKKVICLCATLLIASVASVYAKTVINLFDVSGSIAECTDAFQENIKVINNLIDSLDKNDRFILFLYRSHSTPYKIVDVTFPKRRGGGKKLIKMARAKLKEKIAQDFDKVFKDKKAIEKAGGGTDIVGAFQQIALFLEDYPGMQHPVSLYHFSDGVITTGIGSFDPNHYKGYIKVLKKYLSEADISFDNVDELHWYGATCYTNKGLTLTESADLQRNIKSIWVDKLSDKINNLRYLNNY